VSTFRKSCDIKALSALINPGGKIMLSDRSRFLVGGVGGIAPVLINLFVIDLAAILVQVTPLVIISYLIRVAALFSVGGFVAYLNQERDPYKIFQLGIAAPALITAIINGNNVTAPKPNITVPRVPAAYHITIFPTSAYAQAPDQDSVKQFTMPKETPSQQLSRGFFGTTSKNIWFVIAASHVTKEQAEQEAQQIRQKGFSADVYAPYGDNPYFAVVIGAALTLPEAQALRVRAIEAGLRRDTYLWTFPELR
jgi:hypothetical protein